MCKGPPAGCQASYEGAHQATFKRASKQGRKRWRVGRAPPGKRMGCHLA